ncbi:MAG: indole-3-glycerol phosphate synthase TrpC [Lachnospiraceae bacterium]|nr:indole-3-glycerol phosphate synthase TrpC [Lachnospiraceae bacterium]
MAADIIKKIAADKKIQVAQEKKEISYEKLMEMAMIAKSSLPDFIFEEVLQKDGVSFICEVKKASPSKGIISKDFPYMDIAREYERAGADCISVLTESKYFLGNDRYLSDIRKAVKLPIIRKDFIVDTYQIYQAKVIGANAVLLICSLMNVEFLEECIGICNKLGISALVEVHSEDEVQMAIRAGARMIGVNNRNLKDFSVDVHNSIRLRKLVPKEMIFVAESGIRAREDIKALEKEGVNAVLVGESLMQSESKEQKLKELKGII